MAVAQPAISVGTPREYGEWLARLREAIASDGAAPDAIERIDARYNYRENRITIYGFPDPADELSISQTLSHEYLHALLSYLGEHLAARLIDLIAKPVGNSDRVGGI